MPPPPASTEGQGSSTRPYLIRALHDWCTDNGFTPYMAVYVDETVQVPHEYVKNHEIVLNVGFDATSGLRLGNETVEFKARFGGVARDIVVPVDHVIAIYARENGQGMAFPVPSEGNMQAGPAPAVSPAPASGGLRLASAPSATPVGAPAADGPDGKEPPPSGGGGDGTNRPSLKRIK
jgi:stringent starvation protein B